MKQFISKIRSSLGPKKEYEDENQEEEYVEISRTINNSDSRYIIRSFNLREFEDIKEILDALRKGKTICSINIREIKDKDLPELKRAISKLKKTCDAIDGEIAGVGEDLIVATPSFATIYKQKRPAQQGDEDLIA